MLIDEDIINLKWKIEKLRKEKAKINDKLSKKIKILENKRDNLIWKKIRGLR